LKPFEKESDIFYQASKISSKTTDQGMENSIENVISGWSEFHQKRTLIFRVNFPNKKNNIPRDFRIFLARRKSQEF